MFAVQANGRAVTTVKGLAGAEGEIGRLQETFLRRGASQCGYCTPGMLLIAHEFLAAHSSPSREEIRRALSGNLCRCTGYTKIVDAIQAYAAGGDRASPGAAQHEGKA
jgi:carbon-monoxide dehydrogenase small subunit